MEESINELNQACIYDRDLVSSKFDMDVNTAASCRTSKYTTATIV